MKIVDKFTICSSKTCINIHSDTKVKSELIKSGFLYQYIPEVNIPLDKKDKNSKTKYLLYIKKSKKFYFKIKKQKLYLGYNFQPKKHINDLITLIDYFLEYIRQKEGIYCVHGSAISWKGKAILIIGPVSGLGKTSLAINLCSKHEYKFIGDEKILIDFNLFILGGIKQISFNKPQMSNYLEKKINLANKEKLEKYFLIEKKPAKLSLVIQPLVSKGGELEIEKWSPQKADFHFYEELSRKIRGTSRRIINFSVPLESIDSAKIAYHRSKFSKKVARNVQFYWIKGDISGILKKVNKLIKETE